MSFFRGVHPLIVFTVTLLAVVSVAAPDGKQTGKRPAFLVVDVKSDLVKLGIAPTNVAGDGRTDDSGDLQAAIDFVATNGGGILVVPPGVYRVANLEVKPGVEITGVGAERTVFRAWSTPVVFRMRGGALRSLAVYGTQTAELSGDNWRVGRDGVGRGGTAKAIHCIGVYDALGPVSLDNLRVYEARYDCLYVRTVDGLRVINCRFDRAGRNIVSLVGDTRNFVFSNCRFGSHWGLYHVDIEHNTGKSIRDGMFVNCLFDGSKAGEMGTDTWGRMLILSGHEALANSNVSVVGCTFKGICIRVRGVFPAVRFLYNPRIDVPGSVFVRVRTNPVGEFRNAVVRGNRFYSNGRPTSAITAGVTFTGSSLFEGNTPATFDGRPPETAARETTWREEHPAALQVKGRSVIVKPEPGSDTVMVRMPLGGHEFRFSDRTVTPYNTGKDMDIALHIDPFIALGQAGVMRLGRGRLEDFTHAPSGEYSSALWGLEAGDVIAIRTHDERTAILQILALTQKDISFRYRLMK